MQLLKTGLLVLSLLAALALAGCGGGGDDSAPAGSVAKSSTPDTPQVAKGAATGTGSISGSVTLVGDAPPPVALKMDADAKCHAMHPDGDMSSDVVVNANGTLKWVFVRVTGGLEGHTYTAPAEPVLLDQVGCRYQPHVFGVMAGQDITIRNSDDTMHNIHSLPKNSRPFNLAMPRQGMEITKKFTAAETMVRIKCDVHPWMESWAGVVDNPFFAVTDDQGNYTINNLPAGTYTIAVWHEKAGVVTQSVTVGDGASAKADFSMQIKA
jgi:plastocyanin